MIKGFAHLCFIVSDLKKSVHFYCEGLGFRRGFDFVDDKGKVYGVYLHIGGRSFIELFTGSIKEPLEGKSYKHFCLEVDNLEETVKELTAKQIEFTPIKLGKDNSYQSWIKDPDGNQIELHEYTAESKQAKVLK